MEVSLSQVRDPPSILFDTRKYINEDAHIYLNVWHIYTLHALMHVHTYIKLHTYIYQSALA